MDQKRKALPPGKRRSASGKIHYEYRANRTDILGIDTPGPRKRGRPAKKRAKRSTTTRYGRYGTKEYYRNIGRKGGKARAAQRKRKR